MKMLRLITTHLAVLILYLAGSLGSVHAANSDEIVFFLSDPLGSAIAAVNESGELCWTETYTPYGDKTINEDTIPGLGVPDGCGKVGEERGYTGHTEDAESDLVYAQQRYYDPSIGRFMSVDPAAINPYDVRTINRYSYAANNPYKYTDPNGESIKIVTTGLKVLYKGAKNKGNFKDAGIDELIGVVDDVSTLFDGRIDWNDLGALSDLALGTDFSSKKTKVTNSGKNFAGKQSRNQRLKDLVNDEKVSSADRGWIKQEMNEVAAGKKGHLRNPPGKDLAHERGRENKKGYGYEHSHLQNRKDHRTQHKLDNWGKNNKERPL